MTATPAPELLTTEPPQRTATFVPSAQDKECASIVASAAQSVGLELHVLAPITEASTDLQSTWEAIRLSEAVIVDLTGSDGMSAGFYLGVASAIAHPIILLAEQIGDVPSDYREGNVLLINRTAVAWQNGLQYELQLKLVSERSRTQLTVFRPPASVSAHATLADLTREALELRARLLDARDRVERAEATARASQLELKRLSSSAGGATQGIARSLAEVEKLSDDHARLHLDGSGSHIDLVRVPAGETLIGQGDVQREVFIDEFWISRTAVTNIHFAIFLNAVGNRDETGRGFSYIDLEGSSPVDRAHIRSDGDVFYVEESYGLHPVTYVNWFGANAFSEWLGCRLPSSDEWEKAARGTDGRRFPWGDAPPTPEVANVNADGSWPRDVVPRATEDLVPGMSPYGVVQIVGNVWHWTATAVDGRQYVVRGGSFLDLRIGAPTAYRFAVHPSGPDFSQGFHIVRRLNLG